MENKEKQKEEDISSLFLWGAAILYITVICMTFAGLVALDEHGKSVVVIFTAFVKDYGSLLAGIPVLIAVIVAKQQLDANRRQHVAQIKRSFQKELDALNILKNFSTTITGSSFENAFQSKANNQNTFINSIQLTRNDLGAGADLIPTKMIWKLQEVLSHLQNAHTFTKRSAEYLIEVKRVTDLAKTATTDVESDPITFIEQLGSFYSNKRQGEELMERARDSFLLGNAAAFELEAMVEDEQSRLSQYWS